MGQGIDGTGHSVGLCLDEFEFKAILGRANTL